MVDLKRIVVALIVLLCLSMSQALMLNANVQALEIVPNSWTSKAPIPKGGICGAAALNGIIYVMGSSTNYAYNPATDTWTLEAPMPTARCEFAIAVYGNKIYVMGGYEGAPGISCSVNQVYDPSAGTWANASAMPIGISEAQANVVDGKIYVIGGRTGAAYSTINVTEIYDPATDSWAIGAPMPYPVASYASAVVDNCIYVIGGQDEWLPLGQNINVNFTQIYTPSNNTWCLGASIPGIAFNAGAGATAGVMAPKRIYVFGGSVGFGVGSNQTYVYNPAVDSWSVGAAMPAAAYGSVVAVVNDRLYIIGGGENMIALTNNYQYTPFSYGEADASSSPSLFGLSVSVGVLLVIVVAVVVVVAAVVFLTFRRRGSVKLTKP